MVKTNRREHKTTSGTTAHSFDLTSLSDIQQATLLTLHERLTAVVTPISARGVNRHVLQSLAGRSLIVFWPSDRGKVTLTEEGLKAVAELKKDTDSNEPVSEEGQA
jgi:hypothetical protein